MRNILMLLLGFAFLTSCQKGTIEKPDDLIDKDKMADIIYDLSLLQAMRGYNLAVLDSSNIDPNSYVYKKYGIDSVQFAHSNRYYASDPPSYNRMYKRINDRLIENKILADSLVKQEKEAKEKESAIIKTKKDTVSRKNLTIKETLPANK